MRPKRFSVSLPLIIFSIALALPTIAPAENVLYTFRNKGDGAFPYAGLIADGYGNLYGTTAGLSLDGYCNAGCGTVFQMKPPATKGSAWSYAVLYAFTGSNGDGEFPGSGLSFDNAGNLYGTTGNGGFFGGDCHNYGCGTVFELSPNRDGSWTETVLYRFKAGTDGRNPQGTLVLGKGGVLYGATVAGGGSNSCLSCGTVFRLTPPPRQGGAWTEQVLHRFNNFSGGFWPEAGVARDKAGALYGTTNEGGQGSNYCSDGCGVVFKLAPPSKPGGAWTKTVIYRFTGERDGGEPYAGVTFGSAGNLYGTTSIGHKNAGAVYQLTPPAKKNGAWTETTLYTCSTSNGPYHPTAGVIFDNAGNAYGTSEVGGVRGLGDVFKLKPPAKKGGAWTETTLYTFKGGKDGRWPYAGLVFGKDSALYGTTLQGGGGKCSNGAHDFGCGTVFRLVP
jgi:hypothetical protein